MSRGFHSEREWGTEANGPGCPLRLETVDPTPWTYVTYDPHADYRSLVEQIPAVTYISTVGEPPTATYVSPQVESLLGYGVAQWLSEPSFWLERVVHPEDRGRVGAESRLADQTGAFHSEYRTVAADGRVVWVRDSAVLVLGADGAPLYWRGVMFEITAQKTAEDALRASEARYRALVEQLPAVVYMDSNDPEPRTIYVSPNVESMLGYPAKTYLEWGDRWLETIHPDDVADVRRAWARSVELHEPFRAEYRFIRPDGSEVWVQDSSIPIASEGGKPFWQGVILDRTAQEQAEMALRTSEQRYRALVEGIPAVIYEMGPDDERRTLYVSPHVEHVLGYSRDEWLDQPDIWIELLHPDDREIELAAHDLHNETGEPWSREYRLVAADGRFVWVRDQAVLVRDGAGGPLFWQGVMLDISPQKELEEQLRNVNDELEFRVLARTAELAEANEMMSLEIGERKRIEEQLREAEERYRLLVERMPAVAYVWEVDADPDDNHLYTSPKLEEMLGYAVAEWNGSGLWIDRIHPHDRERVLAAIRHTERSGEPFGMEFRYLAKDGHVVWVLDQASLLARDRLGRPKLFQGVMLDITARKAAETKAAEAEARYRMLAEQGPVIAYIWERSPNDGTPGPFTYVSPQIERVLGYPRELLNSDLDFWITVLHPDDRDRVLADDLHVETTGEPWSSDYRVIAADGRVVWLHDEGRLLTRDAEGRPKSFHGILMDITARRAAEERLREAEQRYRTLIEEMPAIPFTEVVDPETGRGRFTYIGPQVESILGYSAEELLAEPDHLERMLHPDDRERLMAASADAYESGEPWDLEYRVLARDGRTVWLNSRADCVQDDQGRRVWHGVALDVTAARERALWAREQPQASRER